MDKIRYDVREDRTVVSMPDDPDDFYRVPCWTVTRVTGQMAWHIGKYKTEEAANWIAGELQGFAEQEIG